MNDIYAPPRGAPATPIWFATEATLAEVLAAIGEPAKAFAAATGFTAKEGQHVLLPAADGALAGVVFGIKATGGDPFAAGKLPGLLPAGSYRFANDPADARLSALAFGLGAYRFGRYRSGGGKEVRLAPPQGVDAAELSRQLDAVTLARDLVNTPSNDMGPAELEAAARAIATRYGAQFRVIVGEALLAENFPLIHAVGRASPRAPRLIDFTWGDDSAPKVTLVGKGVCFDTGGLDLKPSSAMLIMKKDMGGAASVLAAAQMIMDRGLKVRLRVLIPAVENAVGGAAFRPLDVIRSRKGITVEVGNTDAEGRLVLADELALAEAEAPYLL
ncbi:MAG: leucyl aminopeptidase family protein, partial [Variibacter sp.]|nr:leucyl aminopeptidase family protein [Variibacter sp.]